MSTAFLLLLSLGTLAVAGDITGTWIGAWKTSTGTDHVCLALEQAPNGMHGRLVYGGNTQLATFLARSANDDRIDFEIQGRGGSIPIQLRAPLLTLSGTARTNGRVESLF